MTELLAGQRLKVGSITSPLNASGAALLDHPDVDVSLFVLDSERRVRDDAYLVFFNQPVSPGGAISLATSTQGTLSRNEIRINFAALPEWADRIALVATSDSRPIGALSSGSVELNFTPGDSYRMTIPAGGSEQALILAELYRHGGDWRLTASMQGFDGGMAALIRSFGGEVAEDSAPAQGPAPAPTPVPAQPETRVSLQKKAINVVLEKNAVAGMRARVMVVMDASGSMGELYADETVQETLERLTPIASQLDDNGAMEFWYYASRFARMGDLDADSVQNLTQSMMPQNIRNSAARKIGYGNSESPVMRDVLTVHAEAQKEDRQSGAELLPTLVLFITDGGIDAGESRHIRKVIEGSVGEPLFWQFVGLGNANYGVLQELDTISGRSIDNSGFFSVDDISTLADAQLYERLLSQFTVWWRAFCAARGTNPVQKALSSQSTSGGVVSLAKKASVSIQKASTITITLKWGGRGDLDLYAFYVLKNGTTGKVYYRDLGRKDQAPFITLSGDSRVPGSETITIWQTDQLSHVIFAAYSAVENGAGSFASYQPTTIFTDNLGQEVHTPVRGRNHFSYWVVLSSINLTGSQAVISHVERYSSMGTENSPLLKADGQIVMNKGPVEFKTR